MPTLLKEDRNLHHEENMKNINYNRTLMRPCMDHADRSARGRNPECDPSKLFIQDTLANKDMNILMDRLY